MNGTISVLLVTHYGYYFFCCASFDTLLVYQICLLFFLRAVISQCLPSGGFSQTLIPSTLHKTHFTSGNTTWRGSSQDMMKGERQRPVLLQGKRWWDWHPFQMDTIQKYLQASLNWFFFSGFHCTPFLKLFWAAICYNVPLLCCQTMILAFPESLQ